MPLVPPGYSAELFFIRKPKNPKWTYIDVNGSPIFNANSDLQDFELDYAYLPALVIKILMYCGLSIREELVMQSANGEEVKDIQKNQ
jgi:hypothetical protein